MSRLVLYVAHPLGAPDPEGLHANLEGAMRWLAWLRRTFPEVSFVAPWIASVLAGDDDSDPRQREAGIVDALVVIPRLDGIVLCGGRVSAGMARERSAARRVWDLTVTGSDPPPASFLIALPFERWALAYSAHALPR